MSKENQIKEMALIICGFKDCTSCISRMGLRKCGAKAYAERFYNAGYRKQSEGEWIWINQAKGYLEPPYGDTCKCSLCEFVIDISESNYKYCPNCGAKMKGG